MSAASLLRRRSTPPGPGSSASSNDCIRAIGMSSGYDGVAVIEDIDLMLAPGEVVALLGPNGAGKTTTMMTLAGAITPLAGTVDWRGDTGRASVHRRARKGGLSLLPDDRSLTMSLTGAQNLRIGRVEVDAAVDMFPALADKMNVTARDLSGGEQQMLAVARALGRAPAFLFADELSMGLAPLVVANILDVIRARVSNTGLGALLVEQHVQQVLGIADRAYVMVRGRIVAAGAAQDIIGRLDDIYAAYLS